MSTGWSLAGATGALGAGLGAACGRLKSDGWLLGFCVITLGRLMGLGFLGGFGNSTGGGGGSAGGGAKLTCMVVGGMAALSKFN